MLMSDDNPTTGPNRVAGRLLEDYENKFDFDIMAGTGIPDALRGVAGFKRIFSHLRKLEDQVAVELRDRSAKNLKLSEANAELARQNSDAQREIAAKIGKLAEQELELAKFRLKERMDEQGVSKEDQQVLLGAPATSTES